MTTMLSDLARSGINSSLAKKLGLKELTARQFKAIEGVNSAAYEIPFFNIEGKRIGKRYRILPPDRASFAHRVPFKYFQRKKTPVHLYMPVPMYSKKDIKSIREDPTIPILETEGEKKVICANLHMPDYFSMGFTGVWCFKNKTTLLLPEYDEFQWQERIVLCVYDSDAASNPHVQLAASRHMAQLAKRGALPCLIILPPGEEDEKQGLDDFIMQDPHSALERFEELPQIPWVQWKPLNDMSDRWAFIRNANTYIDVRNPEIRATGTELTVDYELATMASIDTGKEVRVAEQWRSNQYFRREHEKLVYRPGFDQVTEDNCFNLWRSNPAMDIRESVDADISPFHILLDNVIGKEDKHWFLSWLAYPLQNPGTRLSTFAVLSNRAQGIGKSLMAEIICEIYGHNASIVDQERMLSDFNGWAAGKQFIVCDEFHPHHRKRESDILKHLTTAETLTINEKYQKPYVVENYVQLMVTTNHDNAIYMDRGDRRVFVGSAKNPSQLDWTEVQTIRNWREDHGAARLLNFLLEYDCGDFNPHAPAPFSEAKKDMVSAGQGAISGTLFDWIHGELDNVTAERKDRFATLELWTAQQVANMVEEELPGTKDVSYRTVGQLLRKHQVKCYSVYMTKQGGKRREYTFYAMRNENFWEGLRPRDLKRNVVQHLNQFQPQGQQFK